MSSICSNVDAPSPSPLSLSRPSPTDHMLWVTAETKCQKTIRPMYVLPHQRAGTIQDTDQCVAQRWGTVELK
ncbi:hypothetical protein DVA76_19120 [Acinetobacter baumannii]|nr:hypothetical protein DVA76_19120 [Acinetobacter baumannii]